MILLHQQEYFLQQQKSNISWEQAYKLPTTADRLVIEFRKWFDKYSQGKLPWNEVGIDARDNREITENREELLNRYKQHTQHCSSCRNALKSAQRMQIILISYFAVVVSVVALLPDAIRLKLGLPLIVTALLGLGAYAWLKFWLIPRFYFLDYIHPEKL